MQEKMRAYLDELFSILPATEEVEGAKEELYAGMTERYSDCLLEGMDEQEAYDHVLDNMGDLHELFDELRHGEPGNTQADGAEQQNQNENEETPKGNKYESYATIHEFIDNIANFTSGLVSGLFGGDYTADMQLVNTRTMPLQSIQSIDVSFITESLMLGHSEGDELVIREYMNRNDPSLYASVNVAGNCVSVKTGRRQGVFGLRSRVEILVPHSFTGSLALSTVGGSIKSEDEWKLASFSAKTVSGEVYMNAIEAGVIRLSSTSGTVRLDRGLGTLDLHSVSGSIRVHHAEGGGSFRTTSGTVRVHFEVLNGHVDASSISGGVRLGLPADASFEFDGRSVSGNIHTGFDDSLSFQKRNKAHGFIGEAPYYHVRASSTSGGIHVND